MYCTIEDFSILTELHLLLCTNAKWCREQEQCCAWADRLNLVAYMCKDELKIEYLSLSITLNHNPRCNISSLCDISINLFRNNALWCLTWSLSPIYEHNNLSGMLLRFVLQVTSLIIQYITFFKFIKIYIGYHLRFSELTPRKITFTPGSICTPGREPLS